MKYFVDYTFVNFSGEKKTLYPKKKEIMAKNDQKAVEKYEKFKKKTKEWLNMVGWYRHSKCDFHGLYKIVRKEKIMVIV